MGKYVYLGYELSPRLVHLVSTQFNRCFIWFCWWKLFYFALFYMFNCFLVSAKVIPQTSKTTIATQKYIIK